jgi:hypothetical protein
MYASFRSEEFIFQLQKTLHAWSDALSKRFTRKKTQNYRYFFYFIGLSHFLTILP